MSDKTASLHYTPSKSLTALIRTYFFSSISKILPSPFPSEKGEELGHERTARDAIAHTRRHELPSLSQAQQHPQPEHTNLNLFKCPDVTQFQLPLTCTHLLFGSASPP